MTKTPEFDYEQAFGRNYGIFTNEEQEKIRNSNILMVGSGGVGGVLTVLLARCGIEHFVLVDPDCYEPTNINRQVACFSDTLGKNKAEVIADEILRINPEIKAVTYKEIDPDKMDEVIKKENVDIVVGAADDFAMSVVALREANKMGKPAIMPYPVGMLARVSVSMPGGPSPEQWYALPTGASYETLRKLTTTPFFRQRFRKALEYYRDVGGWRDDWFELFLKGERPHAQICPIVWITAALGTLEILKLITGKWKPVVAPLHWHITPTSAGIEEFKPPSVGAKAVSLYFKVRDKLKL